jgi:hypothetical protein
LGRALLSRLTEGIQRNVLAVNTHRPLFWFLGLASGSYPRHSGKHMLIVSLSQVDP